MSALSLWNSGYLLGRLEFGHQHESPSFQNAFIAKPDSPKVQEQRITSSMPKRLLTEATTIDN
jgi:hypothetical protein